jgi:hypothetical protein
MGVMPDCVPHERVAGHAHAGTYPSRKKDQRKGGLMDFDLNCETCLRLWVEYAAATTELRSGAAKPGPQVASVSGQLAGVINAMLAHEAADQF